MQNITSKFDVQQNGYWIQYTSLMLIVLTFTVAVLFAPDAFRKAPRIEPKLPAKLSTMSLQNIFQSDSSKVQEEEIQGIIYALTNHDLDSEIYVYGENYELALARSISLYRYMIQEGVPADAVVSYAAPTTNNDTHIKVILHEVAK